MINKFKKLPILVKISLLVIIVIISLWKLTADYSYRESREHDRLPVILNSSIKMDIVDSNLYSSSQYREGISCSQSEQQSVFQAISESNDSKPYTCRKFSVDKGTFYWLEKNLGLQLVILEESPGNFKIAIEDTGEYADFKNYPGINSFRMRGNSKDVIFIYEGWNNPRKVLKLIIN